MNYMLPTSGDLIFEPQYFEDRFRFVVDDYDSEFNIRGDILDSPLLVEWVEYYGILKQKEFCLKLIDIGDESDDDVETALSDDMRLYLHQNGCFVLVHFHAYAKHIIKVKEYLQEYSELRILFSDCHLHDVENRDADESGKVMRKCGRYGGFTFSSRFELD